MNQLSFDDYSTHDTPQAEADRHLFVKFFYKTRPNKAKDPLNADHKELPDFVEVEYYDIKIPGERDSVAGPATDTIRRRFPRHYAAFVARTEAPVDGMALANWAAITRAQVEELAYKNIKTIEQLAGVADSSAAEIRGLTSLKQKAKAFLESREDNRIVDTLTSELEARDKTIATLEERLAIMEQRFEEGVEPSNKRRKKI